MTQHTLGQPGLKPNDGPAFPCSHVDYLQFGMSLRDYFAGQAVGAILTLDMTEAPGVRPKAGEDGNAMLARLAYSLADAMLAERAK